MALKTDLSYQEFLERVEKYNLRLGKGTETDWRYGQVLFNVLSSVRRDIAELVRGTQYDPFNHDDVLEDILKYIASKW